MLTHALPGAQVGVCSGLVLGFLATVLAVHLIMGRRVGVASKGSTSPVGNYSSTFQSPGERLWAAEHGEMQICCPSGMPTMLEVCHGRCPICCLQGTCGIPWCGIATRQIRKRCHLLEPPFAPRHSLLLVDTPLHLDAPPLGEVVCIDL